MLAVGATIYDSFSHKPIPMEAPPRPSLGNQSADLSSTSQFPMEAPPYPCHPERSRETCCAPFSNATAQGARLDRQPACGPFIH
jgi:hypothetical protein